MGNLPFNIQWLFSVDLDELASQVIVFLLQQRSATSKKFTAKDFKHALLIISVQNQMCNHITIKKQDIKAKFQSTPATVAELIEQLNEVLQQVETGFFNTKIKTPDLPKEFMVAVKKAVQEVHI